MPILRVRHQTSSASQVRRSVTEALALAGVEQSDCFDAALIASELVGNAVRHAPPLPSGQLRIEWSVSDDSYTIAVTDGGGVHELTVPTASVWDTSGRGLAIVAAVTDDWGVRRVDGTTTVWARARLSQPLRATGADGQIYAVG